MADRKPRSTRHRTKRTPPRQWELWAAIEVTKVETRTCTPKKSSRSVRAANRRATLRQSRRAHRTATRLDRRRREEMATQQLARSTPSARALRKRRTPKVTTLKRVVAGPARLPSPALRPRRFHPPCVLRATRSLQSIGYLRWGIGKCPLDIVLPLRAMTRHLPTLPSSRPQAAGAPAQRPKGPNVAVATGASNANEADPSPGN